MQRPPSPPAPSALSPVRPPALNKEWLRQMHQQVQHQHDHQNGSDGVREPTVQNNPLDVHKSLVDEMERHNQALTLIYAGRPTPALTSPAYIRRRQHPSDGAGISYPSETNSRSASTLPLLDDDDPLAFYHEQLERQEQQQRQRLPYPLSDRQEKEGRWEEGAEEDEEEEDGHQTKGMYATCTTFASHFPGEQDGGEPAPSKILEDVQVTELLKSEKFEKSIFVKAALQLLLDKAGGGDSNSSSNNGAASVIGGFGSSSNSINTSLSTKATGRVNLSSSVAVPPDDASLPISLSVIPPSTCSTSILKSGLLKKANHHAMGAIWKNKLVEVHQGLFVYENDDSLVGRRRKTIPLHASICSCKPVASKKNNVFELALKKHAKRLWMCTSEEERNEWVQAINGATVVFPPGGGMGGQAIDPSSPYAGDMVRYRDLRASVGGAEDKKSYQRAVSMLLEKEELCVPFPWIRRQIFPSSSSSSSSSSTAPFSSPFYLYVRRRPNQPHHPHHHNLHSPSVPIHHQHQLGGGGGSSSSSTLTQLWKDMMRDKVCINGRTIHGESGPEAILGALARTLSTLAKKAKEYEQDEACCFPLPSLGGLSFGAASAGGGVGSSHHNRAHNIHHTQYHHHHRPSSSVSASLLRPLSSSSSSSSFSSSSSSASSAPHPPLSALNEVEVVSHTMDILLACNRTQSGGDTYYCIEYLLRNPELVVVCPYSSHAEPLHISLELVEEESVISVVSSPPSIHSPLIMSPEQQEEENRGRGVGGHRYSLGLRGSRARGPGSTSSSPQRWYKADSLPSQLLHSGPTEAAASSPVWPSQQEQQQLPPPPIEAHSISPNFSWTFPLSAPQGVGRQLQQPTGGESYDFSSPGRSSLSSTAGSGSSLLSEVEQNRIASTRAAASSFSCASAGAAPIESEGHHTIPTGSLRRPVILVKIQANTSYKVCPLDPQDGDDNDIWGLISARFEQHFIVSGGGLAKSDELIRLKTTAFNKNSGSDSSHSAENDSDDDQSNRPLSASTEQMQHQGVGSMLSTTPRSSSSEGKGREQQPQSQQQRQTTGDGTSPPDGAT